ncbi:response regulator transcription factor [Clostridioides mangenotii]|nr:response regulator transcription factor [Clostridioides mangenotii]
MLKKVLIIEDEENISDLLDYSLSKEGYDVRVASNGKAAFQIIDSYSPNLIILDLMLPDISGLDICKEVNTKSSIPIIMLTAKSDTVDKILGFELGADDYITKPFNIREVIARVKSIFRRIELLSTTLDKKHDIVRLESGLLIDKNQRYVKYKDELINLTNKEYELIMYFIDNKNRVLSRSQLLKGVWGIDFECESRTVDIHIQRLRKKLGDYDRIQTVIGTGYKLCDKDVNI